MSKKLNVNSSVNDILKEVNSLEDEIVTLNDTINNLKKSDIDTQAINDILDKHIEEKGYDKEISYLKSQFEENKYIIREIRGNSEIRDEKFYNTGDNGLVINTGENKIKLPYILRKINDQCYDTIIQENGKTYLKQNVGVFNLNNREHFKSIIKSFTFEKEELKDMFCVKFTTKECIFKESHKNMISNICPITQGITVGKGERIECYNATNKTSSVISIRIHKDRLESFDMNGFNKWLDSSQVFIYHPLIEEKITEIENINVSIKSHKDLIASEEGVKPSYILIGKRESDTIDYKIYKNVHKEGYYDITDYGCIGDGEFDNTLYIQEVLDTAGKNGGGVVIVPRGNFKVTDKISINYSNITLKGEIGNKISYHGLGMNNQVLIRIAGTYDNVLYNCIIDGLNLDGTHQQYKGGSTMETMELTSPNPMSGGIFAISGNFTVNLKIVNNTLYDFVGYGIVSNKAFNTYVAHNFLWNCSGSGCGSINTDYYGDGINLGSAYHCLVENNIVINKRTFLVHKDMVDGDVYGKPAGRSGLEFEYSLARDISKPLEGEDRKKYAPLSDQLVQTNAASYALTFRNNYVYGYFKGCHIECIDNCIVEDNTFIYNYIGTLDATGGTSRIRGNYYNPDGIGTCPQGGYDWYARGQVAITHFLGSSYPSNPIIENNTFIGNKRAVIIGRNNVTIRDNYISTEVSPFWSVASWYYNLVIDGNVFTAPNDVSHWGLTDLNGMGFVSFINNRVYCKNGNFVNGKFGYGSIVSNNNFLNCCLVGDKVTNNSIRIINDTDIDKNGNQVVKQINLSIWLGGNFENNYIYADKCIPVITYPVNAIIKHNTVSVNNAKLGICGFINNIQNGSVIVENNNIGFSNCTFGNNKFAICTVDNRNSAIDYSRPTYIRYNYISGMPYSGKILAFPNGGILGEAIIEGNIPHNKTLKWTDDNFIPINGKLYEVGDSISTHTGKEYLCTKEGYYSQNSWIYGNKYTVNKHFVLNPFNNYVYRQNSNPDNVKSSYIPTHIKGIQTTEDSIVWECFGQVAEFEGKLTSIKFHSSSLSVTKGNKISVPSMGYTPSWTSAKNIIYSTDNESVATVNEYGVITGIEVGECNITATSVYNPELKCSCKIIVK